MILNKKIIWSILFLLLVCIKELLAQIPEGYYNGAYNQSGYSLKTAIHQIIKSGHVQNSYNSLWTHFQSTDKRSDGKIWDMYSNCTFIFGSDQCGNYKDVCDCYNREHSFPKSWFNDGYPMYADLFHLYPTDGKVNGMRGNYPFGETNGTSWGTGKVGSCTFPGYSGTVFEPADEYKGDFARTYFYMATRYEDVVTRWDSDMLAGNKTVVFTVWAQNLLLKWHYADPVSQKEIDRNNAVYKIQNNRNPFIDYPELVDLIWGSEFGNIFNPGTAVAVVTGSETLCEHTHHVVYRTDKGKDNYNWNVSNGAIENNVSNLDSVVIAWGQAGTGKVSVTYNNNGGQLTTGELSVTLKERPTPTISGEKTVLVNTEGYIYVTESGMSNYIWSFSGNVSLSEGGTPVDYTAVLDFGEEGTAGIMLNYTQNGCSALEATALNVEIVPFIGIDDPFNNEKSISVAPNPAKDFIEISFSEPFSGTLLVYDMLGNNISRFNLNTTSSQTVDASRFNNGMYILKWISKDGSHFCKKIIIIR